MQGHFRNVDRPPNHSSLLHSPRIVEITHQLKPSLRDQQNIPINKMEDFFRERRKTERRRWPRISWTLIIDHPRINPKWVAGIKV